MATAGVGDDGETAEQGNPLAKKLKKLQFLGYTTQFGKVRNTAAW